MGGPCYNDNAEISFFVLLVTNSDKKAEKGKSKSCTLSCKIVFSKKFFLSKKSYYYKNDLA